MMGLGFSEEEARTCDINGCYEYNVKAKEVKTIAFYLNLLKPLELVFNNGIDPITKTECSCKTGDIETLKTFHDFYIAYIKQLDYIMEQSFKCANDFEQYLGEVNPANVFSGTIENSLQTARDAYAHGSVYNNTAVLHTGLGTAADALIIVKQFVYHDKKLTLSEMKKILENDWKGYEKLRLKIQREKEKYGNGLTDVDLIAEAIARFSSNKINMRPNSRGGFYKAAMHSARTFITLGELTGATPDGRKKGEEMSKNISPTMGMDINGVTALLNTVGKIDSALFPEDYALDVMLHPAAVQGDDGLNAMSGLVRTYMARNGASIQFNIFDAKTLIEAQNKPEKYQGLQVRVCGWNVRFTDLCKKEQDAYIQRAMNIK
jgi:formate C-acetyltransferase